MRDIRFIIIHCTQTSPTASVTAIRKYWKEDKGWINPGYHYLITNKGVTYHLLPIKDVANGALGYNYDSIHIGYVGGLDSRDMPKDTRSEVVKTEMMKLIQRAKVRFPDAVVLGHCDLPDVRKTCPNFNVMQWIEDYNLTYL